MQEQTRSRNWGPARIFALAFGVLYVAVALTEVITQDTLTPLLEYSAPLNAIHWAIGVLLLIAAVAGERISRIVARVFGVALAVATVCLLLSRGSFEGLLDYQQPHPLPGSYLVLYGATALIALVAGFVSRPRRRADAVPA
jgi:peptidoglycan/LPS O-acetylase OafA/YrhL